MPFSMPSPAALRPSKQSERNLEFSSDGGLHESNPHSDICGCRLIAPAFSHVQMGQMESAVG